MQKLYLWII